MTPRRRVLVVSYHFPPVGGAGVQRVAKFARYLPESGWDVSVLQAANPSVPLRDETLLAELPADTTTALGPQVALESENLLTQTRLLLDSPVASDARMRTLLDDLELVLAQVARLEPAHRTDDLQLIHAALAEHDLVPRIRSAAATYAVNNDF